MDRLSTSGGKLMVCPQMDSLALDGQRLEAEEAEAVKEGLLA